MFYSWILGGGSTLQILCLSSRGGVAVGLSSSFSSIAPLLHSPVSNPNFQSFSNPSRRGIHHHPHIFRKTSTTTVVNHLPAPHGWFHSTRQLLVLHGNSRQDEDNGGDDDDDYGDDDVDTILISNKQLLGVNEDPAQHTTLQINPLYVILAIVETIYWYWLAPGIDPNSRWFAPTDGVLIGQLLDPTIVLMTPGYAYSSLLLNSFLILPSVWALLLLQEEETQWLPPLPFCLAGFFVGGGALIPYMIVRKSPNNVDPLRFPPVLECFEQQQQDLPPVGPIVLVILTIVVLVAFISEVTGALITTGGGLGIDGEWTTFVNRLQQSQFTSLALFDFIMLSCAIIDPLIDDADRRGYTGSVWPFVIVPLIGPVAWIVLRPKYKI